MELTGAGGVTQTAQFWRHPCFEDLALLKARFTRHRYALHTHPGFVIALVTAGCERLRVGRRNVVAPAGSIILVNPEECHDGEAGADGGWAYRTFYPSVALMRAVASDLGNTRLPAFPAPLVEDSDLARMLALAHTSAESDHPLTAETAVLVALRHLIIRHADGAPRDAHCEASGSRRRFLNYLHLIDADSTAEISLERLAAAGGVTRYQVIRDFRRETGLTPGAFIRNRRLRRAGHLIERGESLAAAAAASGFSDQSHLTRAFNAVHGITPRAYQRGVRPAAGRRIQPR